MLFHEGDDIPTGLATETVENLLLHRHSKGGRFLSVKWTESFEISTGRPQRDPTFGDHFNDVASAPNFVDRFAWHVVSFTRTVHGESPSLCQTSLCQNVPSKFSTGHFVVFTL